MQPIVHDGWVAVPYSGDERADIHLAVGEQTDWRPAYRDWVGETRVVKVRPPAGWSARPALVWLSVDGYVTQLGSIAL